MNNKEFGDLRSFVENKSKLDIEDIEKILTFLISHDDESENAQDYLIYKINGKIKDITLTDIFLNKYLLNHPKLVFLFYKIKTSNFDLDLTQVSNVFINNIKMLNLNRFDGKIDKLLKLIELSGDLDEVDLSGTRLDEEDLVKIIVGLQNKKIKKLDLSSNIHISINFFKKISDLNINNIENLELDSLFLGDHIFEELKNCSLLKNVRKISIKGGNIRYEKGCLDFFELNHFDEIDLSRNAIEDLGFKNLFNKLNSPKKLYLNNNLLTSTSLNIIAEKELNIDDLFINNNSINFTEVDQKTIHLIKKNIKNFVY